MKSITLLCFSLFFASCGLPPLSDEDYKSIMGSLNDINKQVEERKRRKDEQRLRNAQINYMNAKTNSIHHKNTMDLYNSMFKRN